MAQTSIDNEQNDWMVREDCRKIIRFILYFSRLRFEQIRRPRKTKRSTRYDRFKEEINAYYMQFLLMTTLYELEPWERLLLSAIFLLIISFVTYSVVIFLPFHIYRFLNATIQNLTAVLIR